MLQNFKETVLELQLPYCETLPITRTVFDGGDGPKVAVVSGLHGDELEGLYLCHRVASFLDHLCSEQPEGLLGRIELFPCVNALGIDSLDRAVPPHGVDLNRNFPGHGEGLFPQRIAAAVVAAVRDAAVVVDVHASNIYLREIPQIRINHEFAETLLPLAQTMNVDVAWVHGSLTVLEATLAHSLNDIGTPCLVVEMGVGMRITPQFTEQLVVGLLRTWRDLGVLAPDLAIPDLTHFPLIADDDNVRYLNAEKSGIFVPEIAHWSGVGRGQRLGRIVSPYGGETLSEVCSPIDGVLFTLREFPLVHEGSLMARIMVADGSPLP